MSAVIYPTTNLAATEQLKFERADGVYVYDQDGKQYLEGMAGLWCTGLGYGNRELIDAISDQLGKLSFSHTFGGKTHQPVIDLGDKLADMVPVKDAMVFFDMAWPGVLKAYAYGTPVLTGYPPNNTDKGSQGQLIVVRHR